MTSTVILTRFGQEVPALDQLGEMARGIVRAVGNGRPAPWAGFVWYQPCDPIAATVEQQSEGRQAAA
jgi:hypothetical protein